VPDQKRKYAARFEKASKPFEGVKFSIRNYEFRCRLERGQLHFAKLRNGRRVIYHTCRLPYASSFTERLMIIRESLPTIDRPRTCLDDYYRLTTVHPAHTDRLDSACRLKRKENRCKQDSSEEQFKIG